MLGVMSLGHHVFHFPFPHPMPSVLSKQKTKNMSKPYRNMIRGINLFILVVRLIADCYYRREKMKAEFVRRRNMVMDVCRSWTLTFAKDVIISLLRPSFDMELKKIR